MPVKAFLIEDRNKMLSSCRLVVVYWRSLIDDMKCARVAVSCNGLSSNRLYVCFITEKSKSRGKIIEMGDQGVKKFC